MKLKTRIYAADADELISDELFQKARAAVTPERRRKADRFVPEKSKRLSLAAGLLFQNGAKDLGIQPKTLLYSEKGKPYIEGNEVYFNLSHSGSLAICVFSETEAGCDIEIKDNNADLAIAKKYFTGNEYLTIMSAGTREERADTFFRLWTLKESFMKATGLGMSIGLGSFEINIGKRISVAQNVNERDYYFHEYDCFEGYRCAVCAAEDNFEENVRFVSLRDILR